MKNFTPLDYLKIDIATMRGLDQEQFEDRIAWCDRVADNPDVSFEDFIEYADKPYQYMAAVQALEDALAGVPTGHLVGLDASASGIAIMGVSMGCAVTCKNTGVIGDQKMDMYTECTKEMNSLLGTKKTYDRKTVKYVQMPYFYGSEATAKDVFGEGTDEYMAFYEAQNNVAPGAVWLRNELLMSWQPFALNHHSTMPDGFVAINPVLSKVKSKIEIDELNHAQIQYIYEVNKGEESGLSTAANPVHQIDGFLVRELSRRCNYDMALLLVAEDALLARLADPRLMVRKRTPDIEQLWKNHEFMSLVGIEYVIDHSPRDLSKDYCEELLALVNQVLEYQSFECVTIHDEYKCHPNHVNRMRMTFIEMMAELAESDVMAEIIRQMRNDPSYKIKKLSDDLGDLIRDGEYAIA